jgi:hypothetical protein
MNAHTNFTAARPVHSQTKAALDATLWVYGGTFLGFIAGVAFMLMSARMGFLDALSAGAM